MKRILFSRDVAYIHNDFFKGSFLNFNSRDISVKNLETVSVYDALSESYLLMKEKKFSRNYDLLGAVSRITIDKNVNPSLIYYGFSIDEFGRKIYGVAKNLRLEPTDKGKWIEFMLNAEEREVYNGLFLNLPDRFFLKNPAQK